MSGTMSCRRPCEQSVSLFVILTTKTPDVTKFSHARRVTRGRRIDRSSFFILSLLLQHHTHTTTKNEESFCADLPYFSCESNRKNEVCPFLVHHLPGACFWPPTTEIDEESDAVQRRPCRQGPTICRKQSEV